MEGLIEKVARGEIKLHEIEGRLSPDEGGKAVAVRRKAVEKMTGKSLWQVGSHTIDLAAVTGRNIDSPIGAVQVPVGVAGPVKVRGGSASGEYPIFLATTEGALVASVNRGCSCINKAGGATAAIIRDEMTRAPVFKTKSIKDSMAFVSWVCEHFQAIKAEAETTTRHGKLKSIAPFYIGRNVWLRFAYETGDAAGLNMVTIATQKAADYIASRQKLAKIVALSGNVCVDKKASGLNFVLGRGKTVVAEAVIPRKVLKEVLKCSPEEFAEVNYRKNLLGSILANALSFNAHQANIIAAAFIALGQDAAHVVDGSMGVTTAELDGNGDLYVSVTIPALYVATIGGGTRIETQRELLGATGAKSSRELAEIISVAALAGEISLIGALATGTLATAHARLGR
ncbi:MAG: hydroxymethylglutaryl-CoA reductase (NADPH) [Candidatus ainarchaeum sp.]|nr:hydroxymethylglutaryl-CoA reductase (NADPH) [Candidatus ainarchaeum sp.]